MKSHNRSNVPLKPETLQLVQAAAHNLWKEIEVLQKQNLEAEAERARYTTAAGALAQTLETVRKVLEVQEVYINSLASSLPPMNGRIPPSSPDATSKPIGQTSTTMDESHLFALSKFPIEAMERRDMLLARAAVIETELEVNRCRLQTTQCVIDSRNTLIVTLEAALSRLMNDCQASRRVPAAIWAHIFQIRVSDDVHDYLGRSSIALPCTAHSLSRVCRSWRWLALRTPILWCHVRACISTEWTAKRMDLFLYYQNLSKGNSLDLYMEMRGERVPPLQNALVRLALITTGPKNYNIHLIVRGLGATMDTKTLNPFDNPKFLTVHNFTSARLEAEQLTKLVESNSISQLAIHGRYDYIRGESFPQPLTHLTLDTTHRINSAGLAPHFKSLVELHLMNDEFSIDPDPTERIILSELKVLGTTPSHEQIAHILQLPALETAIFYPGPDGFFYLPKKSLDSLALMIKKATNLHLTGWEETASRNPGYSAAVFVVEMLRRETEITTVKFRETFVQESLFHEQLLSLSAGSRRVKGRENPDEEEQDEQEGLVEEQDEQNGQEKILKETHFDRCAGLTEAGCENLSNMIGIIKVFM
ncbi:hypothetical protein FRC17_011330 [Serendipita sp. 399]|nr:hypothetical protein FRC17_011330 [Serendipita sp. 399]